MRRLTGTAFSRWYDAREREAIEQARAILREPIRPWGVALPGIDRHLRAQKAASVLENFLDLADRVRGVNGDA
jgi:hypothetical protein